MDGGTTLIAEQPSIIHAYLEEDTLVIALLTEPPGSLFSASDVTLTDISAGKSIPVLQLEPANQAELIALRLAQAPTVTSMLNIALPGYLPAPVRPRNVLNGEQYLYRGSDLGSTYQPTATSFRLWAPTASDVQLLLYDSESGPLQRQVTMLQSEHGTWYARVPADLRNWYYLYQVTVHATTRSAVDPYARAIAVNGSRGMIVPLPETDPPTWSRDDHVTLASPTDAVIYEVHVRDFSIHPDSGMARKGKYLAFTEEGTTGPANIATGLDHLKEMGITHVQLQPLQAFASVDENDAGQYNWGYDPRNFNVPSGAYATTPHGAARISECKQMIQSLHNAGIGVVLDVVYNHTFAQDTSDFDKIVPQYYYRTDYAGNYTNGSGVGNELATERPMVRMFILDSLTYWTSEYHIDGFRFDLMALLGIETMQKAYESLHSINPHVLLYGEPWGGGSSGLPANELLTTGRQKDLGVAVFNDHIRDSLCGSVFDVGARGFATGAGGYSDNIRRAVEGSIADFTASPQETINYVTSHDNYTLWDRITLSAPADTEADQIKMDELAQAVILTSQGLAFLQGGEEMLRSKGGNGNSYNAGDAVNQFDWSRKEIYWKVWRYYAGLIYLRRAHPAFRMNSPIDVRTHLSFLPAPENTLMVALSGHANGDSWENILVIYNPNRFDIPCPLPPGSWTIVVIHDRISEDYLKQASGVVIAPAISCVVLYQ